MDAAELNDEQSSELKFIEHEHDDLVEVFSGRHAVSSGEPSLDGSIDIDEERGALSDSDLTHAARSQTIASQVKGPSSDALEESCKLEEAGRQRADEWEDIFGNGELLKKILRDGYDHTRPVDGQWVTIKVIDTLRGLDTHENLRFVTGFSMVIDAWELVVKLMVEGEVVAIRTRSRFAYGDIGLDDIIPSNQDQEYTMELVQVGPSPSFAEMPESELIDFVLAVKDRGNFYFSRGEYEKAIFTYKRALSVSPVSEESDESLRKLFSAVHSNLAVVYSKLEDWPQVLTSTSDSLRLHAQNTKALFRRAKAFSACKEFDEAIECLKSAIDMDPTDAMIRGELDRLSGLRRRRRVEEKQLYKKMLAGAGDDERAKRSHWSLLRLLEERQYFLGVFAFFIVMSVLFVHFLGQM